PNRPKLRVSQIPWLTIPFDDDNEMYCNVYSLLEKKVCTFELPEARGNCYCGSSNGWLVKFEDGLELHLLNPFTMVEISLPTISTFPNVLEYQAEKHGEEYTIVRQGRCPGTVSTSNSRGFHN
ncbi:unnamed protein product, partial [Ilex paraguariensis]